MLVSIDLCECDFVRARQLGRELFVDRGDLATWAAPVGVEVGDDDGGGRQKGGELRGRFDLNGFGHGGRRKRPEGLRWDEGRGREGQVGGRSAPDRIVYCRRQ